MSNPEHLYVRMRPYDKQAGNVVRRYDWRIPNSNRYLTFTKAGVWHKVPFRFAEALRNVHQDERNQYSPPVFDVCTEEEARAFDFRAKEAREAKRRLAEPSVDTAVDMSSTGPSPKPSSREAALKEVEDLASGNEEEDEEEDEEDESPPENLPDMSWTKKELQAEARKRGIPISSSDSKAMLLQLLNK